MIRAHIKVKGKEVMLIFIFLGGIFLTAYALYRNAAKAEKHTFICRHCGKRFHADRRQLFFSVHTWGEYKLKCPQCGMTDYCAAKDGKSKKQRK